MHESIFKHLNSLVVKISFWSDSSKVEAPYFVNAPTPTLILPQSGQLRTLKRIILCWQ